MNIENWKDLSSLKHSLIHHALHLRAHLLQPVNPKLCIWPCISLPCMRTLSALILVYTCNCLCCCCLSSLGKCWYRKCGSTLGSMLRSSESATDAEWGTNWLFPPLLSKPLLPTAAGPGCKLCAEYWSFGGAWRLMLYIVLNDTWWLSLVLPF